MLVVDPAGQDRPQAFFATDDGLAPERIVELFVLRWNVEVTFEETRRHLGVETQRQWSDLAIARTECDWRRAPALRKSSGVSSSLFFLPTAAAMAG